MHRPESENLLSYRSIGRVSQRGKPRLTPPASGKVAAAPKGREYRVVLVDSSTARIVQIIGALSELSKLARRTT